MTIREAAFYLDLMEINLIRHLKGHRLNVISGAVFFFKLGIQDTIGISEYRKKDYTFLKAPLKFCIQNIYILKYYRYDINYYAYSDSVCLIQMKRLQVLILSDFCLLST